MENNLSTTEKVFFGIFFTIVVLSTIFCIFTWINFLFSIDLMTAGTEMLGSLIAN
jgi:cell division protein FtsL